MRFSKSFILFSKLFRLGASAQWLEVLAKAPLISPEDGGGTLPAATTLPRDGAARTANSQQMVQTCHHVWPWALSQCCSAAAGFVVHPLRAISGE